MAMQGEQNVLLEGLDFASVGEASDEFSSSYACCDLGGWCVLVVDFDFPLEDTAKALPPGHLVLASTAYDVVMFSSLRAYNGGVPLWSVVHDPDKDLYGVAVEGDPPAPFSDLKREFDTIQAAETKPVDHIFDLPGRLGKTLCSYDPGEQDGLIWTVLAAKGSGAQAARRSIVEAIRSELVPYLQSLGWEAPKNPADASSSENILRHVDGQIQTIFFRFMSGPQTYIQVIFETRGKRLSGESHPLRGQVDCRRIPLRPGKWQGFFKPRLPPPDPIDEAIAQAKADIMAVEDFLKTDVRPLNIQFFRQWEPDADGKPRPVEGELEA
jgi:hypothetical protein